MAAEAYGLLVKNQAASLPLKNVSVSSFVQGYLLGIQSVLKYENNGVDPVEVLFRTPVDASHAVVGLEAVIDGRRIRAEMKDKEEARAEYDDAIASGRTAAIGEEKKGDVFSLALGNLPPGKEAEIHLTMVGELEIDAEGSVRFALPTVLKPRYTPLGSEDPLAPVTGAEALACQVRRTETPSVYSFELNIAGMEGIADVTSPSHKIRTTSPPDSGFLKVQLDQDGPVTEDIVILIKPKDPHQPMVVMEPGKAGSASAFMSNPAVMVSFFPEFKGNMKQVPCEFIFVVDRSGSMSGQYIKEAAETLMLFLKSLPEACYFNIVGFGSQFETLFPESVPYNQSNLDKAIAHTEELKADLGGTHLYSPLEYIFSQPLKTHLTRQVFVLTDGSVSNTAQVIGLVRKNASKAGCFSFGIGSGASTHLVRGIAEAGRGTAEFVTRGERMQPKVIRSLKHAMQPAVTGTRVTFDLPPGYCARVAPTVVPPIFIGERTIVYALLESSNEAEPGGGKATVTIQGHLQGETVKHTLEVKLKPLAESGGFPLSLPTIHHLTGKAFIRDLLLENEPGEMAVKEEVVKLSCECGVISKHTAFIAIDEEQKEPVKGSLQTWDVVASRPAVQDFRITSTCMPMYHCAHRTSQLQERAYKPQFERYSHSSTDALSQVVERQHSVAHEFIHLAARLQALHCDQLQSDASFDVSSTADRCQLVESRHSAARYNSGWMHYCDLSDQGSTSFDVRSTDAPSSHRSSGCMSSRPAAPRTRTQKASARSLQRRDEPVPAKSLPNPTRPVLSHVISLQLASGAWTLSAELASLLGQSVQQLKTACPASPCEGDVELVWATALALCYLEKRHAKRKDEWELLAVKASEWLAQHVPEGHTSKVFQEKADKTLAYSTV